MIRPSLEDSTAAAIMTQVAQVIISDQTKKRKHVFPQSPLWKLLEDFMVKREAVQKKRAVWKIPDTGTLSCSYSQKKIGLHKADYREVHQVGTVRNQKLACYELAYSCCSQTEYFANA